MTRKQIRIGVATALVAVTVGVVAPSAMAAEGHTTAPRSISASLVAAEAEPTNHAEFVSYLNSAEGQALLAEAELTSAEREALYSSDATTDAVVQSRLSGIIKLLKKVRGWAAAAKANYTKFKEWYNDKVPSAIRWIIRWGYDLYTIYTILKAAAS
ncbi:hypothetical protein AB0D34_44095 [Streptomyces sp. NPDC048420]|uniref:hypothetical protein n=1 Tax=Streptomyces sp. NPDC048420 TaxID=3155755 RepID=UPI00342A0405